MLLPRALPVLVALALPASAAAKGSGQTVWKVTKATHSSTASKPSGDNDYRGTSTASWHLAEATKAAPNKVTISRPLPSMISGLGQINAAGSYAIDAATRDGHCAFTAATGDTEHPAVAPGAFTLSIANGTASFTGAVTATLASPYLGTECSTDVDEPAPTVTSMVPFKASLLKRKSFTLRFHGSRTAGGETSTWSTVIVLKRTRGVSAG